MRTLRQLANDEESISSGSYRLAPRRLYDVLIGAHTYLEAKEIQRQLSRICLVGRFPLKKWSANDAILLENISVEDRLQGDSLS